MLIKMKHIKRNGLILPMISLLIIALIMLSNHLEIHGISNDIEPKDCELMVLFNKKPDEQELAMLLADYESSAKIIKHVDDYALVSISDSSLCLDIKAYLDKHPLVRMVENNGTVELMQTTNDTYSAAQWAINNPGYYSLHSSNSVKKVNATQDMDMDVSEAWIYLNQEEVSRREVIVAIIDTGVDYTHPDLADNVWVNKDEIPGDGIDNDNNGYVDDVYGWDFYNDDSSVCHYKYDSKLKLNLSLPEDRDDHGTHIAGIIGAVSDNGIGIAGIASQIDIKLMVLKINGGTDGTGSISDAILAIKYATMMGAEICNISWGTSQSSSTLKKTIEESDMLFVTAAGNLGKDNDINPVYPASFRLDNLISVTFIDAYGNLNKLSNYGKTTVELAAPGMDILSTVVGSYQTLSGTSMAAPHVSAVAALLYSYDKPFYPSTVKDMLVRTIKPIPALEGTIIYPGIPNAHNALQEVEFAEGDSLAPIIKLDTLYDKSDLVIPVTVLDEGGAGIRVVRWLSGVRTMADFGRGTGGLPIENNIINLSRAGACTVYTSDYAGNESIQVYKVEDDKTSPTITARYTVAKKYKKRTVHIKVTDKQSGIKRVKYMSGKKNPSDFLPAGSGKEIIINNGKASFDIKKDGTYTLYAIDNRGNQVVKRIVVKTIVSEELKITTLRKAMKVGDKYKIKTFIKPANTTDIISYSSSDKAVAIINSKGEIVALKEGTATITIKTNNGKKAACKIVVTANP